MHCDGCAKSVSDALFKLPGITKVEPNVKDQLVAIEGTGMGYHTSYKATMFKLASKWSEDE